MGTRNAEIKASMAGIKMRIWSEMDVLSANLLKEISWQSLVRALGRVENDLSEVEKLYTNILTMMDDDDDEDEDECDAHQLFQTKLFTLRDLWVWSDDFWSESFRCCIIIGVVSSVCCLYG